MKKILIILILPIFMVCSCSKDLSCAVEKEEIINYFEGVIEEVKKSDNPDQQQIDNLRENMLWDLARAC